METISEEALQKLKHFGHLLQTWQSKMNLVSNDSLPHAWERHFLDSLQLLNYIPNRKQRLIDLGSGAGFPGLVLALARPKNLSVTLVESDLKKCVFLENVSRETIVPVTIVNERIEVAEIPQAEIITARGLAPLSLLLNYAFPLMNPHGMCLFLKGKSVDTELSLARQKWKFDLEIFPSLTDPTGRIIKITNLTRNPIHV